MTPEQPTVAPTAAELKSYKDKAKELATQWQVTNRTGAKLPAVPLGVKAMVRLVAGRGQDYHSVLDFLELIDSSKLPAVLDAAVAVAGEWPLDSRDDLERLIDKAVALVVAVTDAPHTELDDVIADVMANVTQPSAARTFVGDIIARRE